MNKSINVTKKPLNLNLYSKYNIDHRYSAYEIFFDGVNENEIDDLEHEYLTKGYKLFSSELSRSSYGKFQLRLIVAKLEMIF